LGFLNPRLQGGALNMEIQSNWIFTTLLPILLSGLSTYLTLFVTNLLNRKKLEKETGKIGAETSKLLAETNRISSESWKEYSEKIDRELERCKLQNAEILGKMEARICSLEDEKDILKSDLANERFARQELEFKLDRWKLWATRLVKQLKDNDIVPVPFDAP